MLSPAATLFRSLPVPRSRAVLGAALARVAAGVVVCTLVSFAAPRLLKAQTCPLRGEVTAQSTCYAVAVTPDGATTPVRSTGTGGHTVAFTVRNMGTATDAFGFSCLGAGGVSCTSVVPIGKTLAGGASVTVTVTYGIGLVPPGTGRVTLTASGNSSNSGYYNVPIVQGVVITPDNAVSGGPRPTNGGPFDEAFTIQNNMNVANTVSFTCTVTAPLAGCTPPAPVTLSANASILVQLPFTSGANTGVGTLRLSGSGTGSDEGSYQVPIERYGVTVTPTSPSVSRASGSTPYSEGFTVQNTGTAATSFTLSCEQTGVVTCGSVTAPASPVTIDAGASISAMVTYTVPTEGTGTLALRAAHVWANGAGTTNVTATTFTQQAPVVAISDVNAGSTVERSLCLTVALGEGAAAECGDLRLVHALPSTRTMNRNRTPTLLYNSQFAHPYPLAAALVTLPPAALVPDSVTGILTIGGVERARGAWSGNEWSSGESRRIVLGFDGLGDASGIYDYTLEVRNWYGLSSQATTAGGSLAIVNRSTSPFGAGWWLAGYESLDVATMVWTGGDGSVRKYVPVTGMTNVWAAPGVDHPDTLRFDGTVYTRYDKDSVWVQFSSTGQHVETRNRQKHATTFAHANGRLTLITLPVTSGAAKTYAFAYDANDKLATVTAPGPGTPATRVTTVAVASGRVTSIRDPDNTLVQFGHDAGWANRIATRTDRRGTVTTFGIDAGKKISQSSLNMGTGQPAIVTGLMALESRGVAGGGTPSSVDTATAYSRLDGPRTDVTDQTFFWLDRFGAPVRIVDALGNTTAIKRGGGTPDWPGLVTRVRYPNGQVMGAEYDSRGNPLKVTDSSTVSGGRYATRSYVWDPKWDEVTRITQPEGDFVAFSYDPATGNRAWQEDGRGVTSRVTFGYNGNRQLTTITRLGTPAEVIGYDDATGNVDSVTSPKGYPTTYQSDGVGRITFISSWVDTLSSSARRRTQQLYHDLADRDTLAITVGSAAAVESLYVKTWYSASGQRDSVARWAGPDPANVDTITNRWRYDPAGRVVVEISPDLKKDSTEYDPAGNPTVRLTRRALALATPPRITLSYDPLNRLIQRTVPAFTYAQRPSGIVNGNYPELDGPLPAYAIPAETQTFTYDAMGRVLTADNQDARVGRTYHPNGLLATETLRIFNAGRTDADLHTFTSGYTYDLNGRRKTLELPIQLRPAAGQSQIAYGYDPLFGALTSVSDAQGNSYTLGYTAQNELRSVVYPGQYEQVYGYDQDGRLAGDTLWNRGATAYPRIETTQVRASRFVYDALDRLLKRADPTVFRDTLDLAYSGLGHLTGTRLVQHGVNSYGTPWDYTVTDNFAYDALGHRRSALTSYLYSTTGFSESGGVNQTATYLAGTGRLGSDFAAGGTRTYAYDDDGNEDYSVRQAGAPEQRGAFYGLDGRLRAVDWRWAQSATADIVHWKTAFEEYRYDALGRRVWTQVAKECNPRNVPGDWAAYKEVECKQDLVRRTVWDGEQELGEIQMPPGQAETDGAFTPLSLLPTLAVPGNGDPNPLFGQVLYVHALGLDRPLALTRLNYVHRMDPLHWTTYPPVAMGPLTVLPFWTGQGDAPIGVFASGARHVCNPADSNIQCVGVPWTLYWSAYDRQQRGVTWDNWWGSLLQQKRDKSGLEYKRNRYYDPQTGRFTQEDPIGLAGGVNLYGFANGDPINFSDPFGLCPVCWLVFEVGSSLYDLADLAVTSIRHGRGKASDAELAATGGGFVAGLVGFGGGYGRAARALVREGSSDVRLWKQLASQELLAEAQAGKGIAIAGAGARRGRAIDDAARLVEQYGGDAGDWAKMTTRTRVADDGTSMAIHWYENVRTGQRFEYKTKLGW